jgi:Zn-dependent peptidase ImmA (M78 family)/DNA-binding XRE family transcriptional regulator
MFNSRRFAFARRRRGLTKKLLAERSGLSVRSITAYESGFEPMPDNLEQIARLLKFPVDFFFGDDIDEINGDSASFRAFSKMTAGQREAALAAGTLAVSLGRWIEVRFRLPDPDIPNFHEDANPEVAAQSVREAWGLGQRPISNLIHLLESRGVRIFSLAEDCREVDAFSLWDGRIPYIFLNTQKSPERSRFDAAHELGHLVLHQHGGPNGRLAEEEANAFASAFLMPASAVIARAPQSPSLRSIIEGKEVWGVSAIAYAFRLHKVGVLSDWYYHEIARKMSTMGYRTAEPPAQAGPGKARETSQVLKKVFEDLRSSGTSRAEVARQLDIYPEELDKFIFGLVLTGMRGGGTSDDGAPTGRANIKLVRS